MAQDQTNAALQARKDSIMAELTKTEKQLYDAESNYLGAEYSVNGNVIKGFEGFLSSKDVIRKRQRTYKVHDRAFSLSSVISPATKEVLAKEKEQEEALMPDILLPNTQFVSDGQAKGAAAKALRR